MDRISRKKRSALMRKIRARNTRPELLVRKFLSNRGHRYRLHSSRLPGTPDIYISSQQAAVFVHGCFWHHHSGCSNGKYPATNKKYWIPKLKRNVTRFENQAKALKKLGIKVIVIWECETTDMQRLRKKLISRLEK